MLFDAVSTTADCLEAMAILMEEGGNSPRASGAGGGPDFSNATDVADYLVARGVPFREAYQMVYAKKRCLQDGVLLLDLTLEQWKTFIRHLKLICLRPSNPVRWWQPV